MSVSDKCQRASQPERAQVWGLLPLLVSASSPVSDEDRKVGQNGVFNYQFLRPNRL
jgi:hypothetical protein